MNQLNMFNKLSVSDTDVCVEFNSILFFHPYPGKYGFTSQLNCERAQQRRKPHHFKSITDPFDPRRFNFTKIKQCEV